MCPYFIPLPRPPTPTCLITPLHRRSTRSPHHIPTLDPPAALGILTILLLTRINILTLRRQRLPIRSSTRSSSNSNHRSMIGGTMSPTDIPQCRNTGNLRTLPPTRLSLDILPGSRWSSRIPERTPFRSCAAHSRPGTAQTP